MKSKQLSFQNPAIKGKKILVVGLGILGGGLATSLWLLKHGAKLTITDLKSEKDLKDPLKEIKKKAGKIKINFVLGKHKEADFKNNEIIIVNPAVKTENNPYLEVAKKHKRKIENEITLFFRLARNPIIAITGTRGKTTTSTWTNHLLTGKYKKTFLGGNNPDFPVLSFVDKLKPNVPVTLELSSAQLELLDKNSPKIAVITNLYRDHLNRYATMEKYALAKANIFKNQKQNDYLILNYDNKWTNFFLKLKPKAKIYFISQKFLPKNKNGVFLEKDSVIWQENKKTEKLFKIKPFSQKWGHHNVINLITASLAVRLFGLSTSQIKKQINTLPQIKFRQETVYKDKKIIIINDSAGTSPEAVIAALKRFAKKGTNLVLIAGGTDKNLEFKDLAKTIKKIVPKKNAVFLNGSATKNLVLKLKKINFSSSYQIFENLKECLVYSFSLIKKSSAKNNIILFSPGAASFEKFKNEFDRGKKFNDLVKNLANNWIN